MSKIEKIEYALKKFPNARRVAVENFTLTAETLDTETRWNLESDAKAYGWNSHTVGAIRFVLQ